MGAVKGFWLGLFLGGALGAGGVYVALEQPWQAGETAAISAADAGPEPVADQRKKRKKRNKRKRRAGGGEMLGDPIVELTAADRKLVWRGKKVELDAKEIDFAAAGDGARALDQSEINAGIASRSDQIIACITEARGNAELAATITLEALVEGNGRVSRSRVRAPKYLVDNGVHRCIQSEAKAMRFPSTGAQTVVSVPFNLR